MAEIEDPLIAEHKRLTAQNTTASSPEEDPLIAEHKRLTSQNSDVPRGTVDKKDNGFIFDTLKGIGNRYDNILSSQDDFYYTDAKGEAHTPSIGRIPESAGRIFGEMAQIPADIIGHAVKKAYHWMPEEYQNNLTKAAKEVMATDGGKLVIDVAKGVSGAYENFKSQHPTLAKDFEGIKNIVTALYGLKLSKEPVSATAKGIAETGEVLGKEAVNVAKDATESYLRARPKFGGPSYAASAEKNIAKQSEEATRALQPAKLKNPTGKELEFRKKQQTDALTALVENKELLGGALPETLSETAAAVATYKEKLWSQVEQMLQLAGDYGIEFDRRNIADALDNLAKSERLLHFPEASKYAAEMASRWRNKQTTWRSTRDLATGRYYAQEFVRKYASHYMTPTEMQRQVTEFNKALHSVYERGGANKLEIQKSWVDTYIADTMRSMLDKEMNNMKLPNVKEFTDLKYMYGAMSSIEPSVANRASQWAKSSKGQAGKFFGDILTVNNVIDGIVYANPVDFVKAATKKHILDKFMSETNPDVIIGDVFRKIDKELRKTRPFEPRSEIFKAF